MGGHGDVGDIRDSGLGIPGVGTRTMVTRTPRREGTLVEGTLGTGMGTEPWGLWRQGHGMGTSPQMRRGDPGDRDPGDGDNRDGVCRDKAPRGQGQSGREPLGTGTQGTVMPGMGLWGRGDPGDEGPPGGWRWRCPQGLACPQGLRVPLHAPPLRAGRRRLRDLRRRGPAGGALAAAGADPHRCHVPRQEEGTRVPPSPLSPLSPPCHPVPSLSPPSPPCHLRPLRVPWAPT